MSNRVTLLIIQYYWFIYEQEKRAAIRRQEEKDDFDKCEFERIEKILKEKEQAQCDDYLKILRAHPDWYYYQDKIKLVEGMKKAAVVEEQLYPGKRHQRNAARIKREEDERREGSK